MRISRRRSRWKNSFHDENSTRKPDKNHTIAKPVENLIGIKGEFDESTRKLDKK